MRVIVGSILFLWACASPLFSAPAQIIIIRHGEKTDKSVVLTLKGRERSMALVPYFTGTCALTRFGPAAALFAKRPDRDSPSIREIETLQPLAHLWDLTVQTPFTDAQYGELISHILSTPDYEGQMVLICWEHHRIPDLAYACGIQPHPLPFPGERYDLTWVIDFRKSPPTLKVYTQKLLFGDSSQPFKPFLPVSGKQQARSAHGDAGDS